MRLEITIGPPLLTINQGQTVLACEPDGRIQGGSDKGLFFFDTRVISVYDLAANGESFKLLNAGPVYYYASRSMLTNEAIETEDGPIPAGVLSVTLSRSIDGGLHEDVDITNYGSRKVRFNLEIVIRSDFADIFEIKASEIVRRGRVTTDWNDASATLRTVYANGSFQREIVVQPTLSDSRCRYANGRLTFDVEIERSRHWHTCLLYTLVDGKRRYDPPKVCLAHADDSRLGQQLSDWRNEVLKLSTSNEEFYRFYAQSVEDLASLRLPLEGTDHLRFVPAAGIPWFVALFGRDTLITAMQTSLLYPVFARGVLETLGELQATERDDDRDAEPGKILHELRFGELAVLKKIPHTPYYGSADATPLYITTLHLAWRSTGDRGLLERHLATAERCLAWIDEYGDRDRDGFQEYQTRSERGYENQGWKDAGDAVMDIDGSPVRGPKALCELQGYVFDAWRRMTDIYIHLGLDEKAAGLREKAETLRRRFDEAFWDEDAGFYAYCLDGDKRKILSIASNPGHLLWSGIVPKEKAGKVVERLLRPDMWSGWGIRTLSADHPSFNPHSYQNGSIWPHDNGLIAIGFKRYGFHLEAARIARDVSEACSYFRLHQMPELYAGLQRTGASFPVQYVGANVPQAWAAGSVFAFLQSIIGFQPHGDEGVLYLDPWLPTWLPDLTFRDLRVGAEIFDLQIHGKAEQVEIDVLRGDPSRVRRRSFAAASEMLGAAQARD
jgi:glycogen debranching enzyme